MKKYEFYYFPTCPFCKKVLKYIDKNNLREQIIYKNIHDDLDAKKELIDKGGKEQVPCLFINDEAMFESNNIINYLKEKSPS